MQLSNFPFWHRTPSSILSETVGEVQDRFSISTILPVIPRRRDAKGQFSQVYASPRDVLKECDEILKTMRVWSGVGFVYQPKKARRLHVLIEILMEDCE